jgi:hypothetical protein
MRNQRTAAGSAACEGYQAAEMRRRIDGCRERLRRDRAARRIAERATPQTLETAEELSEVQFLAAAADVRGEET